MSDLLQKALEALPHGPEFRFLDRLISLVPGKEGVAEYAVRGDEPFLRGHFADDPMMPGVLLVESAAQLTGVVAQTDPSTPPVPGLKLSALRAVKILGTARPGERLRIESRITGRLVGLIQAKAQVSVAGRVILRAELTLGGSG